MEIENRDREYNEIAPAVDSVNVPKKRKKDSPSPIALEPCAGNKAAVLSLLVRMPTGKFTTSSLFSPRRFHPLAGLTSKYLISDINFQFNAPPIKVEIKTNDESIIDYRFSF